MGACAACDAELPEGARFCPACAAAVERAGGSEERKLATVLFADLVGSTALASDEDPERTRALLDCFPRRDERRDRGCRRHRREVRRRRRDGRVRCAGRSRGPRRAGAARRALHAAAPASVRLDAFVALRDRRALEAEAPPLLRPGTCLEPFALRALGVVREDQGLVKLALVRFEEMGVDWHREQTRSLLDAGRL